MTEPEGDQDALTTFLEERLPALGLDAETYAPYLLPLLTEEEKDDDEWEAVLELLQASSETHSDNAEAWQALRVECQEAWRHHQSVRAAQQEAATAAREAQLQAQLQAERDQVAQDLAKQHETDKQGSTDGGTRAVGSSGVDDKAKQALVARYAYDMDEGNGGGGGGTKTKDAIDDEAPLTNKQVAAQAALDQARSLRGPAVSSKKEEQQKTAQAKQDKARLKEERRKRATKGERKR